MSAAPFFFVTGTGHHTAPLEVREKLTVLPERLPELRGELGKITGLDERLVLATCNRTEIYGIATDPTVPDRVAEAFCRFQPFEPSGFASVSYRLGGIEAVRHLFGVAAGIESKMIGETEILGQVKEAYRQAVEDGGTGAKLHRIFQKSFQAAKWARTHTGVSLGHISIGNVAADLARRVFGDLKSCRILVVGSGEVGLKILKALESHGVKEVHLSSRNAEKTKLLAKEYQARPVEYARFAEELPGMDIALLCTAAPNAILDRKQVAAAMARRAARPLLILDLAVPRDVDPAVEGLDNVFLYNADDLAIVTNEARDARLAEIEKCREGLASRAGELQSLLDSSGDVPTQMNSAPSFESA